MRVSTTPGSRIVRTASQYASHLGFCQPVSGRFGPVQIDNTPIKPGSTGNRGDPYTDSQSLPPIQVGRPARPGPPALKTTLGVLDDVAGNPVDGADDVLSHRRPRAEELAAGPVEGVEGVNHAGMPGMPVRSPASRRA